MFPPSKKKADVEAKTKLGINSDNFIVRQFNLIINTIQIVYWLITIEKRGRGAIFCSAPSFGKIFQPLMQHESCSTK